ncbi:MAG: hypothetical protein K8R59_17050, partial [Thermoanaerobaculales bacterium]|nr:hypothetical protein [Thermoanaerobaculales bacterium]
MKTRVPFPLHLASSVLIGCFSIPVEAPAADVATYQQIQETLDMSACQSDGKTLSVGSQVAEGRFPVLS